MHEFSNSVGLLGSSRDMALHLSDKELQCETTVQQNSSNPLKDSSSSSPSSSSLIQGS